MAGLFHHPFFPRLYFLIIYRIAHTGDGLAVACLSRDDTAEQILLIVTGHGNQKVGGCDAGVD